MRTMPLRRLLMAGGSLLTAGILAATPASPVLADTVVTQPFAAHSGDVCRYGTTEGILGWHLGPFVAVSRPVDVRAVVIDRPMNAGETVCGDDGRSSTAMFSAYAAGVLVDREHVTVDNGERPFSFQLVNTSSRARIDFVVVVVCRSPLVGERPIVCGREQKHEAPVN